MSPPAWNHCHCQHPGLQRGSCGLLQFREMQDPPCHQSFSAWKQNCIMFFNHTVTPPSSYRRPLYLPLHFGLPQWLKEPRSARLFEGSKPSQGLWTWPQMSRVGPLLFPASPAPLRPLEETPLDTGSVPLKWTQRSRSWTPLGQTPTHTYSFLNI